MKTLFCLFLLTTTATLMAGTFVHETSVEFSASGDFNGDGFPDVLVLDKSTGLYRVGYGTGTGGIAFVEGRPTGVPNATGLALGKIHGTLVESFAVTAVAQNRAQILSPTTTGVTVPVSVFSAGHGPEIMAALDLPAGAGPTAEDDLVVVASLDPVDASQIRQIRSSAGTWPILRSDDIADTPRRNGNPIVPGTGAASLFAFMRDSGTTDGFQAFQVTGATAVSVLSTASMPKGTEFICDVFDGTESDVMFWVPGASAVRVRHIVPAGPTWNFSSDTTYGLGAAIAQLVAVDTPGGKRVIARFDGGGIAEFTYTTGSGFSSPTFIPVTGGWTAQRTGPAFGKRVSLADGTDAGRAE